MSLAPAASSALASLAAQLGPGGFDLIQPLAVGWYNQAVPAENALPDLGDPAHLAVVVGHSRALWPAFLDALIAEPALLASANPLDRYTARRVEAAAAALGVATAIRHDWEPPPRRVAIQRLAEVSGLAWLGPAHLSIHPTLGPWFALRSVIVVAAPGPDVRPAAPPPCEACPHACQPALAQALAASGALPRDRGAIVAALEPWIALRDSCPVGRAHRYSDDQLRYHYTADPDLLRRAVDARRG